ncbi:MAG: leucine-rich repeat domain-containing protein [Candidatus Dependentiae bacterium]
MHLQGNRLHDITALSNVLSKEVTRLWLSDNQLTGLPKGLLSLTNLRKLCLDTNQLTSLACIEVLTSLEEKLCLRDNKLTAVPELQALTKLTSVDLGGNPLQRIKQEWLPCKQMKDDDSGEVIGHHYALREIMVDDDVELPLQWLEQCYPWMHVDDMPFIDDLGRDIMSNRLPCVVRLSSGAILVARDSKDTGTPDEWVKQAVLEKELAHRRVEFLSCCNCGPLDCSFEIETLHKRPANKRCTKN